MAGTSATSARSGTRSPVQLVAAAVGAVFLLVGILGFVPGATTGMDQMMFAGHESDALLLGIFAVSVLHNIVHIAFGVVGLVMARTASAAKLFLIGGGIVYVVLWLYGVLINESSAANFVPLNAADNWLHLALAVGMIALGSLVPATARQVTR